MSAIPGKPNLLGMAAVKGLAIVGATNAGGSSMFVASGRVHVGSRCGPLMPCVAVDNQPESKIGPSRSAAFHRLIVLSHPPLHSLSDISGVVAATCRYFYSCLISALVGAVLS